MNILHVVKDDKQRNIEGIIGKAKSLKEWVIANMGTPRPKYSLSYILQSQEIWLTLYDIFITERQKAEDNHDKRLTVAHCIQDITKRLRTRHNQNHR